MTASNGTGGFRNAVFGGRGKLAREARTGASGMAAEGMPSAIPQDLEPASPAMADRLPNGMALLIVTKTDDNQGFILKGAHGDRQAEPLGGAGKPDLDLNSLAFQLEQTATKLKAMASWSREKRELVNWLNRTRDDAEEELELVICDDTGFRIPWELFWLRDQVTRRRAGFLGALMTVTRWLDVKRLGVLLEAIRNPGQDSGPVAAFVHETMAGDKELFRDFRVKYENTMSDLLASLADANAEALAMVYAACHGEFSDLPDGTKLGNLSLESAQMAADEIGFDRLHNRQTLVFLNACASGPVGEDKRRYNDGVLRGFPKMFLEAGAAGVLATAAPVEDEFARQVAGALIERLQMEPGLPPAKAIREFRRLATDSLPPGVWRDDVPAAQQEAANAMLLPLLYWSLYLYYGSPRMVISLARRDDSPAGN